MMIRKGGKGSTSNMLGKCVCVCVTMKKSARCVISVCVCVYVPEKDER